MWENNLDSFPVSVSECKPTHRRQMRKEIGDNCAHSRRNFISCIYQLLKEIHLYYCYYMKSMNAPQQLHCLKWFLLHVHFLALFITGLHHWMQEQHHSFSSGILPRFPPGIHS